MRAGDVTQSQGTALIPGDLINRKQDYRANRREITRPHRSASYLPACPLARSIMHPDGGRFDRPHS